MLVKIELGTDAEILKIDPDTGTLIVRLKYRAQYASAAYIYSVPGETLEDFEKNEARYMRTVYIGPRGGILAENP